MMKENTDHSQLKHDVTSHVADDRQGVEPSNSKEQGAEGQGSGISESQNFPSVFSALMLAKIK
jgi:hypothetical protein